MQAERRNKRIFVFGDNDVAKRFREDILELLRCEICDEENDEPCEDSFVIFFLDKENLKSVFDISNYIRKEFQSTILFVTAIDKYNITVGPTYKPTKNSGIDSYLYYHFSFKYGNLNETMCKEIMLPDFDTILSDKFYRSYYPKLLQKTANEIIQTTINGSTICEYSNKIDIVNLKNFKSKEQSIYPILENPSTIFESFERNFNLVDAITRKHEYNFVAKKASSRSIAVIGGGTSGYLSALALQMKFPRYTIKVIESKDVPIIGVGEATTPDIIDFLFKYLKIDQEEFFNKVKPTWKLGIKFLWGKSENGFNYPFGIHDAVAANIHGNINQGSLTSILMDKEKSFVWKNSDGNFNSFSNTSSINYAYHLDNKLFVHFLREKIKERNIEIMYTTVKDVKAKPNKEGVEYVIDDKGNKLNFDFYVDCTGFRSLLSDYLDNKFTSFDDSLFTNGAVVGKYNNNGFVKPYTTALTMKNGWCWDISLREENHVGYVFSDKYCTEEEATKELKSVYPAIEHTRVIKFKTGKRDKFIIGNTFFVGNSYGFVEPLESTGIHMIIIHIKEMVENLDAFDGSTTNQIVKVTNESIDQRWNYLKWFLAIHFKYNKRIKTPFWSDCNSKVNIEDFQFLIDIYRNKGPFSVLSSELKNNLMRTIVDNNWGLLGVDVILLGLNFLPKNFKSLHPYAPNLWEFNLKTWDRISDQSIPVDKDLSAILQNSNLI